MSTVRSSIADNLDGVKRHVGYAVRTLSRRPGFTLMVVVTLAVTIGANATVFSIVDNVMLRPLPFDGARRLVYVTHVEEGSSLDVAVPPIRLLDWSRESAAFEALGVHYASDVSDTTREPVATVRAATITPDFLELWRVAPALGRDFTDAEHRFGGPSAVLVSDRYWRTRLESDAGVLGERIEVDGQSLTIVGVMPPGFARVDPRVDLWTPHTVDAPWTTSRESGWFEGVVGRLEKGTTLGEARESLALVQARLAAEYPETDAGLTLRVEPYKDTVVRASSASLWLLFCAVVVLLSIACANVAALLLAGVARREREAAIRFSLGASRRAVAYPLLVETAVLVAAGALLGLLVASLVVSAVTSAVPELPRAEEIGVDARVVLCTLAAAVLVTLACGLAPAMMTSRGVDDAMRHGRSLVSPRRSWSWTLVGAQVALSVALLVGAGVLLRSLDELARVDAGFEAAGVLTFRMTGSRETVDDAWVQRVDTMLAELEALPEIEAAATSFSFWPGVSEVYREDVEIVEAGALRERGLVAETLTVSPSYFETMRIPLAEGALCRQPDTHGTQALVNREFVERYFPNRSVIGLHVAGDTPERIVGIVDNARETGMHREAVPTVYVCFSAPTTVPWFLARTTGDTMSAVEAIRERLNEFEPLRSVHDIAPLTRRIADVYTQDRLRTALLTFFALTALALACLGLHGTLSYVVSLRRREIGLRIALGALRRTVVVALIVGALRVVGAACAAGLALSVLFTQALAGMLYGVEPLDPMTLAIVTGLVLAVATGAATLPAVRASRVEPMSALRDD